MRLVRTGGKWSSVAVVLTVLGVAPAVGLVGLQASAAATVTMPDLQLKVPPDQISIGTNPSTGHRQLQFTHITWDAGAGPFEIDPAYNPATGTATFAQAIYNSPSPGTWQLDHTVPLPVTGVFDPPAFYQFPLTRFTLNQVDADGSVGPVVAASPKTDFCMTGDTKVGGVPNTPSTTSPPQSDCSSPTTPLGWSVGWGDEYDQTDSGQPIDLTGVPDGTYYLDGVVDPLHILTESDNINDVTVTQLRISNGSVTVLGQTNPASAPPTVSITSPAAGSNVSGAVSLSASAAGSGSATITSVQWMLNGQPLSSPLTTAPYRYDWTVGSMPLGSYTLSAQATDSNGNIGTAAETVNVTSTTSGLSISQSVKAAGTGTVTANLGAVSPGETLLALVAGDGSGGGGQSATVSGGGLTWTLVQRENSQPGDSEAWTTTVPSPAPSLAVTSTLSQRYGQQLEVLALSGSGGVGASAVAEAASGAPRVSLTTKAAGSLTFAVGNDWDTNTPRTVSAGQAMVAETQAPTGDDYWVQMAISASATAGQDVTLSDDEPTGDGWNFAAVEVVPSGTSPPGTAPTVSITNPTAGETVSGKIPVAANASDSVAVASVQFRLDGNPLGNLVTTPPYAVSWDTTTVSNGTHTLSAIATDTSGKTGVAANVPVTVQNPAPPMTCFVMQASVSVHGNGTVTTPAFDTVAPGEVMLAFAASDGPYRAGGQSVTVSGGGLTWRLVKRANGQPGDAEVWTATAASQLSGVTVTSTPLVSGYDQNLTVVAYEGAAGIGASAASSAAGGAPSVSLTTTAPSNAVSLVFAVGEDYATATTHVPAAGQVILGQWLDSRTGDTYWSQYTNTPVVAGTKVTMADTSPTTDTSDFVAVEMIGDTG